MLHSISSVKEKSITQSLEEHQLASDQIVPFGLVQSWLYFPFSLAFQSLNERPSFYGRFQSNGNTQTTAAEEWANCLFVSGILHWLACDLASPLVFIGEEEKITSALAECKRGNRLLNALDLCYTKMRQIKTSSQRQTGHSTINHHMVRVHTSTLPCSFVIPVTFRVLCCKWPKPFG